MGTIRIFGCLACAGLAAVALAGGCSASKPRPAGPAPEYEPPYVMPWDSGAPVDPLDDLSGEPVPDQPDESDAGAAPEAGP